MSTQFVFFFVCVFDVLVSLCPVLVICIFVVSNRSLYSRLVSCQILAFSSMSNSLFEKKNRTRHIDVRKKFLFAFFVLLAVISLTRTIKIVSNFPLKQVCCIAAYAANVISPVITLEMSQAVLGLVVPTVELQRPEARVVMLVVAVVVVVEPPARMLEDRQRLIVIRLVVGVIDSTTDHVVGFNVMNPVGRRRLQVCRFES